MITFRTILCPVDLSENSERALNYALMLGRWYGARVEVTEVIGLPAQPVADFPAVLSSAQIDGCAEAVREFVRSRDPKGVAVTSTIRQGPVVPEILAAAAALPADLIVMGTQGRSGFERFLLGSVTERVLRKAACPVLTVPHGSIAAPATPGPFQAILCPVDFSPVSAHTIKFALSLAQESGKRLVLLHVFDWPTDRPTPVGSGADMTAERHQLQAGALRELRQTVPDDARNWCTCKEVTAVGRPHDEIVRVAKEEHADLIVMGVHARHGIQLGYFGSTANHVVREAACPVLTVRPHAS
jgi:nucleotide-binding universal stress UspA family protein